MSAGRRFKQALAKEKPLQVVGAVNAYSALLAQQQGFNALYVSGGGVAASSYGLPDLGITTLEDVLIDVNRITNICDLPLLVDIDTGFGGALNISRAIKRLIRSQAAAVQIEDQVQNKRCGHRPKKAIVSKNEMCDRIKAAVDAKTDDDFIIMARTDALVKEGINGIIERSEAYIEAGADMIFPEAMYRLEDYEIFSKHIKVPILANITEFGLTPLYDCNQLADVGVSLVLYPLSAFRAMSKAASTVYQTIRSQGSQAGVIETMQTREQLYDVLDYYQYEQKLDRILDARTNQPKDQEKN